MDSTFGESYSNLYRSHWWWRSREHILLTIIRQMGLRGDDTTILDVGCGDGLFFPELEQFGSVYGIETDASLITPDNRRRDRISTQPLGDPEFEGKTFDLITALDVIEHIEDDDFAVREMIRMLRPHGRLLVTVPAFMMLWDEHDEMNRHYRRYTKTSLTALLKRYGTVEEARYLFHSLFPPKLAMRFVNSWRQNKIAQHHLPSKLVNDLARWALIKEYQWLRALRIPFGTSVLAVVRPSNRSDRKTIASANANCELASS